MCKVYVQFPKGYVREVSESPESCLLTVKDLRKHLLQENALSHEAETHTYFTTKGLGTSDSDELESGNVYTLQFRLRGGKGGFGSMLRALGSQIEKTTNNEACRDLSGRRMRDVNNEKKMMEWVKEKAEKDRQKQKEKVEKLERQLQRPKHFFNDPEYEKSLERTTDSVEDALKTGLKASKRISNEPKPISEPIKKKSKLWLGADDITDSSDSDSDIEEPAIHHGLSSLKKAGEGQSSSSASFAGDSDKATPAKNGSVVDATESDIINSDQKPPGSSDETKEVAGDTAQAVGTS